jgi:DNA-binding transcriptional LysR family regulator
VSNAPLSLTRREADIANRATQSPLDHLVGRRVVRITQAVYGAANAVSDTVLSDLKATQWVGPDETAWYPQLVAWMNKRGLHERCGYRVDSLQGMLAAVRAGVGVAVLPCYMGDADRELVRLGEPVTELSTDLWLLTHPDLRRVVRIRVFMEIVGVAVRNLETVLAGN